MDLIITSVSYGADIETSLRNKFNSAILLWIYCNALLWKILIWRRVIKKISRKFFQKSYIVQKEGAVKKLRYWYFPHHHILHPHKPGKIWRLFTGIAKFTVRSLTTTLVAGQISFKFLFTFFFDSTKTWCLLTSTECSYKLESPLQTNRLFFFVAEKQQQTLQCFNTSGNSLAQNTRWRAVITSCREQLLTMQLNVRKLLRASHRIQVDIFLESSETLEQTEKFSNPCKFVNFTCL